MGGLLKKGHELANPAKLLGAPDPVGDALGLNEDKKQGTKDKAKSQGRMSLLATEDKQSSFSKIS